MIQYIYGNLFDSPAKTLVNTVNTVGVMGKGIAKVFKQIYPEMFKNYQKLCEVNQFKTGQLWLYQTSNKWILNFPTKQHWKSPSKLEFIEKGLKNFAETYAEKGIFSIAFPPLGCGNGELDWKEVKPLMEKYLSPLKIEVYVYLMEKATTKVEHKNIKEMKTWLRNEPQSLSFEEFWEDLTDLKKHKNLIIKINQDSILIKDSKSEAKFYKEDLQDFWQTFRENGYFFPNSKIYLSSFNKNYDLFFSVLKNLDYLETVETFQENGLQLKTQRMESQLVLF